jgi:hypothetical protein
MSRRASLTRISHYISYMHYVTETQSIAYMHYVTETQNIAFDDSLRDCTRDTI